MKRALPRTIIGLVLTVTLPCPRIGRIAAADNLAQETAQLQELINLATPAFQGVYEIFPTSRKFIPETPTLIMTARLLIGKFKTITPLIRSTLITVQQRINKMEEENKRQIAAGEKGVRTTRALREAIAGIRETLTLLKELAKDNGMLVDLAQLLDSFGRSLGNDKIQQLSKNLTAMRQNLLLKIPQLESTLPSLEKMLEQAFGK